MKFDLPYNPKETEEKIYKLWEQSGYFNPDKLPKHYKVKAKNFSIMMAPPNITGSLHMGHVLENIEVDILVRMKRMQGFKTLWLPGIDHAGISAQNVVEKNLRKQEIRWQDLGREKFIKKVKEWKEKYGTIILDQLKTLGISSDWSRIRYTMDSDYTKAVLEAFNHYYKKNWIYRGERVINWCPRCETGVSDLEVEYKEEQGKLYFIKYPLAISHKLKAISYIVVATTRPETMLGDTAVAVNPKDGRYKILVGKFVILPIQNRKIPIIADHSIDMKFGTGAVKVTPAHDVTDFEISLRHNLSKLQIIDEKGIMINETGKICGGLKVNECRGKVIEELQKLGLLLKIEDYTHNAAHCERCSAKIEPRLSQQWFLKMSELAKLAIHAIKKKETIIHPKKWEKVLIDRLKNERDWNISRQLWWGHQLPIWFCKNQIGISNSQFIISKKIENSKLKIENSSAKKFIISAVKPKQCLFCKACSMVQSADVLDTWFSSALWPFATLGWPENSKDLENYYPTDFITSGRDILNIWIAKMIFSGMEFMGKSPFKTVHIHATILNKEGKRMSKSLGTGVDPLALIEKYGADAIRFGMIYQNLGNQDIHFNEDAMLTGKKFANKIWNATRFVLQNANSKINLRRPELRSKENQKSKIQFKNKNLTAADKKIITGLKKAQKEVEVRVKKYEFGQALHKLYDFFWHNFCDDYIEKSKSQMSDSKTSAITRAILVYVLNNSLKLLHPFLPFITEEIWQILYGKKQLLLIENWPTIGVK